MEEHNYGIGWTKEQNGQFKNKIGRDMKKDIQRNIIKGKGTNGPAYEQNGQTN